MIKIEFKMKRIIIDYQKLTDDILSLLVEKFPDGYTRSDIIRFQNAKGETIEAVEVRTEDTIYLVKVSTRIADAIENFDDDENDNDGDDDMMSSLDDDDFPDEEEEEEDY